MTDLGVPDPIETLALQCLERLPSEDDDVVAEVCRAHPELLDAVRAVLRQLTEVGLAWGEGAGAAHREVGDFYLLRELGHGSMGVVWLAEQRSLRRKVALKLLHPVFWRDGRLRERFRREVQALSRLDHPNLCTVYEAGEAEHVSYLAMRFVEGQTLASVLAERRRLLEAIGSSAQSTSRSTPTRDLVHLVHVIEKVARALHVAHEAGLVHRDVKPGNILIGKDGEPIVVDFGLARSDDGVSAPTVSGRPLGMPTHMAPEQITSKGEVDRRIDVYALGALLYECVTLHPPFDADCRDSLCRRVLHDPVPDPRAHNRGVGPDLRAVLEKALEKSPRRRFATALELAEELRRIRVHEPIRTRRAGSVLRTVRWCQHNRAAMTVLCVVMVALVAVAVLLQRG